MQEPKKVAGLDQLMSNLTEQLRHAVLQGIQSGLAQAMKFVPAAPAASSVSTGSGCQVPGCKRAVAARGLCQTHYSKARRIGFNEERLNAEQLKTLGRDGRKARFSGHAG